jgi:hypothetical protein
MSKQCNGIQTRVSKVKSLDSATLLCRPHEKYMLYEI